MKKSICIPVEQYNKMLDTYDEAMKELRRLQRELRTIRYGKIGTGVALVQEDEAK